MTMVPIKTQHYRVYFRRDIEKAILDSKLFNCYTHLVEEFGFKGVSPAVVVVFTGEYVSCREMSGQTHTKSSG